MVISPAVLAGPPATRRERLTDLREVMLGMNAIAK
jgi:hypothetical protein